MEYHKSFANLIGSFRKLPGVGQKSAERMAFYILEMEDEDINDFVYSLRNVRKEISKCPVCGMLTGGEICSVCSDKDRDSKTLTVVQTIKDVYTLENSKGFTGKYHVLNGLISLNQGTDLNNPAFSALVNRVKYDGIKEVIIATNPTIEGETTALYIKKLLEPYDVMVTRLAYGLPVGGHIDYADDLTITRAFEGRRKI